MKAFELNQQIFAWLCICPATHSIPVKRYKVFVTIAVLMTELLAEIASVLFFVKFIGDLNVLENCIYALFQISALAAVIYMWIIAFSLRNTINDIFAKFQEIYDSKKQTLLMAFLNEANTNTIWGTKILAIYLPCTFLVILTTMGIVNIAYCLLVYGHIDGERLYFPYQFVLPWNQRTLYGWIALNLLSAAAAGSYLVINYSFLAFFVGISEHHHEFCKFFGKLVSELDDKIDMNITESKEFLVKLITFHNLARKIFWDTADFFSLFILIQLISSTIYLSCSIFLTDTIMQHFDLSIGVLLFCVFVSLSNLYLYTYFGGRSTIDILSYPNILFESTWFKLPTEMQKLIVIMIANGQSPIYYHGFGVARLNLDTFCALLRMVLSYYMAFKTLTKK